jgi:serine/threonine protein kinase
MSSDEKTRLSPAHPPTGAGTQLSGIYELDERLGSGGMGEVWRGHNIQTGDLVAIKIVLPEFARDQTILSLFRKEASILNHLSHEAVVRYHVFTIDPGIGRPYLAMEYVDGDSLFEVMRRGPMSPDEARRLCHRLASGLGAVHEAGAIHRDLSPDNIILPGGSVERAKIIDFGIARSAKVGGETLIGGRFAGKYNYVSPEQLGLFGGQVSEQSDIYSLALVLAAALRGKPLDMSGSQFDVIEKRRTVPDLSMIGSELRPVLEAMLQPDPRDRPASMAEVAWMTRSGSQIERDEMLLRMPTKKPGAQPSTSAPWSSGAETAASEPSPAPPDLGFVEHIRPVHLSKHRPTPKPDRARAPHIRKTSKSLAITALSALVIATGTSAWLAGFLPPWSEPAEPHRGEISQLKPRPSEPPPEETATADSSTSQTPQRQADTGLAVLEGATPEQVAEHEVDAAGPVSQPQTGDVSGQGAETTWKDTKPPTEVNSSEEILEALIRQSESFVQGSPSTLARSENAADLPGQQHAGDQKTETAQETAPATATQDNPVTPTSAEDVVASAVPAPSAGGKTLEPHPATGGDQSDPIRRNNVAEPIVKTQTAVRETGHVDTPGAATQIKGPAEKPKTNPARPSDRSDVAAVEPQISPEPFRPLTERSDRPHDVPISEEPQAPSHPSPATDEAEELRPPPFKSAPDETELASQVSEPDVAPPAPAVPARKQQDGAVDEPEGEVVALNVPKPAAPQPAANTIAQRIAWLRDFQGGECFFAAPISVAENAVRVEGFATSVDPFETMLEAFKGRFGLEPDFEVRLIDAAQCAVPRFMRDLRVSSTKGPELIVDQMSIPSGGTLSGSLRTASTMRTSLLLIDHAGMVFSLDPALTSEGDKATFSVPITLDAGDNIAGKSLPELLIAISGESDLPAAAISEPTPASILLPRILSEIRDAGAEFFVTTKYFEIGG